MYKLHYPDKISKNQAIRKISTHAMFGENQEPRPKNVVEVERILKSRGHDPDEFAEKCRFYRKTIPLFEELADNVLWNVGDGTTMKVYDKVTGATIHEVIGPGQIGLYDYKEKFAYAFGEKNRAVLESTYVPFISAIAIGIASIESFLNYQASTWNSKNPDNLLIDSKENKVNIETKITTWIPIISNGGKINTGNKEWSCFKELKNIRDNEIIHSRIGAFGINFYRLASLIDKFRIGIAKLLGELHRCCGLAVPSSIINAIYYPNVKVIEVAD